ncbi:MAG: 2-amino-4-hydroxy-6-hydroxymethyldihydropteridine diphosphokinase [Flavobacteriaceae bacterium]|jgi:2-amino-4-hydroxy-6-hydroxymethyldihydropteridine diphosphokinase|nr:2-amino-4-hydroxy-6-hydroxymethyldihydropteridine diphosphokinase [Flavobacteriaceae bacterium]
MNRVVLLLGSNLGNKKNNIEEALFLIEHEIGEIKQRSDLLESAPEGYESENFYLNIGIVIYTLLSPVQLLHRLKNIEHRLGRVIDSSISNKYEDRIIDIDIIYFNTVRFQSKKLKIPHSAHTLKRGFSKKILHQMT